MREKIGQEVSVVMYFNSKKKYAGPHTIRWGGRVYTVKEVGYTHHVWEGKVLHHIFELVVNETDLWMRLRLDTSNLHWSLEMVSDGLAA